MIKPKVTITRTLTPQANTWIRQLSKDWDLHWWNQPLPMTREKLLELVKGSHALLVLPGSDKVNAELLDHVGPQLKVVSTVSVGYDHIEVSELKSRKIRLGFTPDVLTDATADINLSLALMVSRRLVEGANLVKSGGWGTWEPNFMVGTSIAQKVIGILGLGRIGLATAQRFRGFNPVRIIYHSKSRKPDLERLHNLEYVTFEELVQQSDYLSINCSFSNDTKHLFNRDVFAKMKKSAILINSSRGGVVQQDDLIAALKGGVIGGAGLDVTDPEPLPVDSELLQLNNVVVLPHVGSANIETREAMAHLAIKNLVAGLNDEAMAAEVDLK